MRERKLKISEYQNKALETDKIPWGEENGPDILLLGLLGEMGNIAKVFKRGERDGEVYESFEKDLKENLGDLLWHVVIMAHKFGVSLSYKPKNIIQNSDVVSILYSLAHKAVRLTGERKNINKKHQKSSGEIKQLIYEILDDMHSIAVFHETSIDLIADDNAIKINSYWNSKPELPAQQFDKKFPYYEQLPRKCEIDFVEIVANKKVIMQMNGLNVGNRLTDNALNDDAYRYHDVFHLANLATLGWSPVFRSILRSKRKSDREKDEVQDGARAGIIEEAVVNYIYDYARDLRFLEGKERVDLNLILRISKLVRGYEVEVCEPWEWEHCILAGSRVFRSLRDNKGGIVRIDSDRRSIEFIARPND